MRFSALALAAGSLTVLFAGCEEKAPPAPVEKAEEVPHEETVTGKMDHNFDAATSLMDALVAGDMSVVNAYAKVIARIEPPKGGGGPWVAEFAHIRNEGRAVQEAKTLKAAALPAARALLGCARCHQTLDAGPRVVPPDDMPEEKLEQHRWAADRLLDGVYSPHDEAWKAGAEVLGKAPMSSKAIDKKVGKEAAATIRSLEKLVHESHAPRLKSAADPNARAAAYGDLLPTCAACHQAAQVTIEPPSPPM